jgi:hypothetical protein
MMQQTQIEFPCVIPKCPYCSQHVIITEHLHDDNTWYYLHHETNEICGILLYWHDKQRLVEWYSSMEWFDARNNNIKLHSNG